jgi:hypothetical protein
VEGTKAALIRFRIFTQTGPVQNPIVRVPREDKITVALEVNQSVGSDRIVNPRQGVML